MPFSVILVICVIDNSKKFTLQKSILLFKNLPTLMKSKSILNIFPFNTDKYSKSTQSLIIFKVAYYILK